MNSIKQGIIDNIQMAARDAASEALGDIVESALDSVHIEIGDDVVDHIASQYANKVSFTEDDLNAIIHATCLALAGLESWGIAKNAYKAESKLASEGGVPVFSSEGMEHVVENLKRQVSEVGIKAKEIRDSLAWRI